MLPGSRIFKTALCLLCAFSLWQPLITVHSEDTGKETATPQPSAEPEASAGVQAPAETVLPEASSSSTPEATASEPAAETDASALPEASADPAEKEAESGQTLTGMPEGYELSDEERDAKQQLQNDGTAAAMAAADSGDYSPDEVIAMAATEDKAALIATAYNGSLESFSYNMALIRLDGTVTAVQAVQTAADLNNNYPAVYPDYMYEAVPDLEEEPAETDSSIMRSLSLAVPEKQTYENRTDDPFLALSSPYYQWFHGAIGSYAAWAVTRGSSAVKVAVLDSGVNETHEELSGHVTAYDVTGETAILNGHGTHVSGIIAAASGNDAGGSGVAPGISLISIKVLRTSSAKTNSTLVAKAIRKAMELDADIICMSLGAVARSSTDFIVETAINDATDAGIPVFAAAGNDGSNAMCYPAAYDNSIAVAASDRNSSRASFSDYGSWVDLAAPGVSISSCYTGSDSSYQIMSGTSQAAPVAAGVAALYMSALNNGRDLNFDGVENADDVRLLVRQMQNSGTQAESSGIGRIINAENLLATIAAAPVCTVTVNGAQVTDLAQTILVGSQNAGILSLSVQYPGNAYLVYTTDGSIPSRTNGLEYPQNGISLNELTGTVIIRTAAFNQEGVRGPVTSLVLKIKKTETSPAQNLSYTAPVFLAAGKSARCQAAATDALGSFVWSVDKTAYAVISSDGVLSAKSGAAGQTVQVTAALKYNPERYITFPVQIVVPVTKIRLSGDTAVLKNTGVPETLQLHAEVTGPAAYELKWTSSNPKVATVDADGLVTAAGSGSCTITAASTDGTSVRGFYSLKVVQYVTEISLSSSRQAAAGAAVTIKASALPVTARNRTVKWTVDEASYQAGVRISTGGRLSVPARASGLGTVTVTAVSMDGNAKASAVLEVLPAPASAVRITAADDGRETYSSGAVRNAQLFTTDAITTSSYDTRMGTAVAERELQLSGSADNGADLVWTSSSPKTASVNANGLVTGKAAGSAVITATAADGSGRRASMRVTVSVPVSGVSIRSASSYPNRREVYGTAEIAYGRTVRLKASVDTLLGVPTNRRILWSVDDNARMAGVTVSNGYVHLPQAAKAELGNESMIQVTARAADASGYSASFQLIVCNEIRGMAFKQVQNLYYRQAGIYQPLDVSSWSNTSHAAISAGKEGTLVFFAQYAGSGRTVYQDLYSFTITSSNPKVASVESYSTLYGTGVGSTVQSSAQVYCRVSNNIYAPGYLVKVYGTGTGTAVLTARATDGSGWTTSITVRVK